ncbi:MAG: hypothetical protein ACJ768_18730 [Gaiellaceae bacterium]
MRRPIFAATLTALGSAGVLAATAVSGSAGSTEWTCSGDQTTLIDNTNGSDVSNGGSPPSFSTHGKFFCVVYVQTYHWNKGKGSPPGTLALQTLAPIGAAEQTVGPFKALASAGQGGAPNVNWYVYVSTSPARVINGTYQCTDSGTATWSSNTASGGHGFCIVRGVAATRVTDTTTESATTTAPATTTATTTTTAVSTAADELRADLVRLDRRLADVIARAKDGSLTGAALKAAIRDLIVAKRALVTSNFHQSIYGVSAAYVIDSFGAVDSFLVLAHEETGSRVDELEKAKHAKEQLEGALDTKGKAPNGLMRDLVKLDRRFATVIDWTRRGTLSEADLAREILQLIREKKNLIAADFPQRLYGVPARDVIDAFDTVDAYLVLAHGAPSSQVIPDIERAKAAKQALENRFGR